MSGGHIVFRVTSIPPQTSLADLHSALSFPTLLRQYTTLCKSPSSDFLYLTALIHFSPFAPRELVALRNNEAHIVRMDDTGREIAIDRHFYGLTTLYEPRGPIQADIVAVSGLNGHPYGSWAGRNDSSGQRMMWLRHFLSEDIPRCRTMIYGCNTSLAPESRGIHQIPDYSDVFLAELDMARVTEEARFLTFTERTTTDREPNQ